MVLESQAWKGTQREKKATDMLTVFDEFRLEDRFKVFVDIMSVWSCVDVDRTLEMRIESGSGACNRCCTATRMLLSQY